MQSRVDLAWQQLQTAFLLKPRHLPDNWLQVQILWLTSKPPPPKTAQPAKTKAATELLQMPKPVVVEILPKHIPEGRELKRRPDPTQCKPRDRGIHYEFPKLQPSSSNLLKHQQPGLKRPGEQRTNKKTDSSEPKQAHWKQQSGV